MKYLRLTLTPDPAVAPPIFTLLADSPFVEEAIVHQIMVAEGERPTVLLELVGEREPTVEGLDASPAVVEYDLMAVAEDRSYVFMKLDPPDLIRPVFELVSRGDIVILPPARFADGSLYERLLGRPADLQTMVETVPPGVTCDVREIGSYGVVESVDGALSDRQLEALEAARDLGYYDDPRRATHAEVGERLGCAPSTAGEHIRKAESKLVAAVLDD